MVVAWLILRSHVILLGLLNALSWVLIALGFVVWRKSRPLSDGIDAISFDYLPDKPWNGHGWALPKEDRQGSPPNVFSLPPGAPVARGLRVKPTGWYALDYDIVGSAQGCRRLKFDAKFASDARLYVLVEVTSKDRHSVSRAVWLQFYPTAFDEKPRSDATGSEWVLSITGKPLGSGWESYDVSLAEQVQRAVGSQDLTYKQTQRVRLRGTLSVLPIKLSR